MLSQGRPAPAVDRAVLLLLPALAQTACVVGGRDRWASVLQTGASSQVHPEDAGVCLAPTARGAVQTGCAQLLVPGGRADELRRAGYEVTVYLTATTATGERLLAPDRRTLARLRGDTQAPAGRRARLAARLDVPRRLLVASRTRGVPEPLAGAGLPGSYASLVVARDPRRRAALRLHPARGAPAVAVAKVETGGDTGRGRAEQALLHRLAEAGVQDVPRPLGTGEAEPFAWAVESCLPGGPLTRALARLGAPAATALLDRLADWATRLATATAGPATTSHGLQVPADLERLAAGLAGVPGVLVHGDLAAGENVVVTAEGGLGVLDWETAQHGSLPLLDLLPLLCTGLAVSRGAAAPADQAALVVRLARGDDAASAWLYGRVRAYCRAVGVQPAQVGAVALLAWAHVGSMRGRHDALLAERGQAVEPWTSTAELVLERWRRDPALGPAWTAAGADRWT